MCEGLLKEGWLKTGDEGMTDDTMKGKAMKIFSEVVRIKSERAEQT